MEVGFNKASICLSPRFEPIAGNLAYDVWSWVPVPELIKDRLVRVVDSNPVHLLEYIYFTAFSLVLCTAFTIFQN